MPFFNQPEPYTGIPHSVPGAKRFDEEVQMQLLQKKTTEVHRSALL